MIGLGAWSVIAEWKLLGCIIVVLGDFEGQFLPIADSYGPDIRVDRLDIMRQVANSLHVKLTVPKRFEEAHFAWVMSKYPLADGPFTEAHAAEVRARFPYRGEPIDLYIAISHRDRRSLNALANERDRHGGVLVRCVPASGANLPQDMWLRPGMVLLGCCPELRRHHQRRALRGARGDAARREGEDGPGVQAGPHPLREAGQGARAGGAERRAAGAGARPQPRAGEQVAATALLRHLQERAGDHRAEQAGDAHEPRQARLRREEPHRRHFAGDERCAPARGDGEPGEGPAGELPRGA